MLTEAQERQILSLGLQHHVEVATPADGTDEVLEADRVDQIGMSAQLWEHGAADGPPSVPDRAVLDVETRRGEVDPRPPAAYAATP